MICRFSNRSRRGKIWSVMRAFSHVKDGKILTWCVCLPCCVMNSIRREYRASLVAQSEKKPPVMWETCVQSLGWEDPLEEGMATHSSILAWGIPMDRGEGLVAVHGVTKSQTWLRAKHSTENIWQWFSFSGDSAGKKSACQCWGHGFNPWVRKIPWRKKWQPTLVFLPRKSMVRGAWWATVHGL